MPIDIKTYQKKNKLTNEEQIVNFLFKNRNKAYQAVEIANETGISKSCTSKRLSVLKKMGLVSNKRPHWTIEDPHKALDYLQDKGIVPTSKQADLSDFGTPKQTRRS